MEHDEDCEEAEALSLTTHRRSGVGHGDASPSSGAAPSGDLGKRTADEQLDPQLVKQLEKDEPWAVDIPVGKEQPQLQEPQQQQPPQGTAASPSTAASSQVRARRRSPKEGKSPTKQDAEEELGCQRAGDRKSA